MVDSGTTHHMTPNRKSLVDYTLMTKNVLIANDNMIKAIGKGRLLAKMSENR